MQDKVQQNTICKTSTTVTHRKNRSTLLVQIKKERTGEGHCRQEGAKRMHKNMKQYVEYMAEEVQRSYSLEGIIGK